MFNQLCTLHRHMIPISIDKTGSRKILQTYNICKKIVILISKLYASATAMAKSDREGVQLAQETNGFTLGVDGVSNNGNIP